ncbi:hypothetical protein LCGC14_0068240 [marine sediment metagenome]|uniref:Uncharacterized protein n=1 Tax=marine sediment metagenome TaxID=412755 RepID=A0A0F9YP02_9ZZZZ|nr:hypothetical protein [Maribacter sp.]HDZ04198.1 hypothetical protein [Maribacter sp.]HEC38776.1 hypothetical protein [bacterium]
MGSVLVINGDNYLYNVILGRLLGPAIYREAALIIILLLVLSFLGTTFQLATAKFAILFIYDDWIAIKQLLYTYALCFWMLIGIFIFALANNLLVKHYFDTVNTGLYSSLAMIWHVVYFVAWMFGMLLLPAVVQKQKGGEATAPILIKYISYVGVLAISIIFCCAVFPEFIMPLIFGEAYISIVTLLWQYTLATSLLAISNIFAYYFLSLNQYVTFILSGVLGISQIVMIIFFHSTLYMVVQIQIIAMVALLVAQLFYFTHNNILNKTTSSYRPRKI